VPTAAAALNDEEMNIAVDSAKTIADSTRARTILAIKSGGMTVNEICELVGATQPCVSHNLARLRYSGVAEPRREGRNVVYVLTEEGERLAGAIRVLATTK
jgi:DNA-binding transcriptional ArsR family regulator